MAERPLRGQQRGAIAGLLAFLLVAAIELAFGVAGNVALALAWLALLLVAWSALLGKVFGQLAGATPTPAGQGPSRRVAVRRWSHWRLGG